MEKGFTAGVDPVIRRQCDAGKIRVIPNALAWPMRSAPRTKRVVWRGGKSHDGDLMAFLPAIREVSRMPQFGDWEWHFMGEMSAIVEAAIREAVPAQNLRLGFGDFPHQYIAALALLAPWLVIVPLEDHTFNRCKSPLAAIEATAAGAGVLAPAWEAWLAMTGGKGYTGRDEFRDRLKADLLGYAPELLKHPLAAVNHDFVRDNLRLPLVNRLRWEILLTMMKEV